MKELVTRAQNYNSLTIEDKSSLVKDISQDHGLVSELIFSVPNVSFQEELLRYNLHKLKMIIYEGRIIGKLFREEIFSANIFEKEKTLVAVSGLSYKIDGVQEEFSSLILDKIYSFFGKELSGTLSSDGTYSSFDSAFEKIKVYTLHPDMYIDHTVDIKLSFYLKEDAITYDVVPLKDIIKSSNPIIARASEVYSAIGLDHTALFGSPKEGKSFGLAESYLYDESTHQVGWMISTIGHKWINHLDSILDKLAPSDQKIIGEDLREIREMAHKIAEFDRDSSMKDALRLSVSFKQEVSYLTDLAKNARLSQPTQQKIQQMNQSVESGQEDASHWIKLLIKTSYPVIG